MIKLFGIMHLKVYSLFAVGYLRNLWTSKGNCHPPNWGQSLYLEYSDTGTIDPLDSNYFAFVRRRDLLFCVTQSWQLCKYKCKKLASACLLICHHKVHVLDLDPVIIIIMCAASNTITTSYC